VCLTISVGFVEVINYVPELPLTDDNNISNNYIDCIVSYSICCWALLIQLKHTSPRIIKILLNKYLNKS